jgi:hypothetical protein
MPMKNKYPPGKYPQGMSYTQWRRTPWRVKHRLVGVALNNMFGYWRSCADARCRRARCCQDYECYWRRLQKLSSFDEQMRVRDAAAPVAKLLRIGSTRGSEGRPLF